MLCDNPGQAPANPSRLKRMLAPLVMGLSLSAGPHVLAAGTSTSPPNTTATDNSSVQATADVPDERPLWRMLKEQSHDALLAEIKRLQVKHPRWTPPVKLMQLTQEGQFSRHVERAIQSKDDAGLIELAKRNRDAFSCTRIDWAWALVIAYGRSSAIGEASLLAEKLITTCLDEDHHLVTLYKSRPWLPAQNWKRLLDIEATHKHTGSTKEAFRQLSYAFQLDRITVARQTNDPNASKLFYEAIPAIEVNRDAGAALTGGWIYLDAGDTPSAARWFSTALAWAPDSADAYLGLFYCALREGRHEDAIIAANKRPEGTEPTRNALLQQVILEQASSAYSAGRIKDALSLLETARQHGALPSYARTLEAWAWFNSGDYDRAADSFAVLYQQSPTDALADGVVQSHLRAGRLDELKVLAASEPLASRYRQQVAEKAFAEKRFLAAARLDPEKFGKQGSLGTPSVGLAVAQRSKKEAGLRTRFEWTPEISARWTDLRGDEWAFQSGHVRIDNVAKNYCVTYRSGSEVKCDSRTGSYSRSGAQTRLAWQRDLDDGGWMAELGTTPNVDKIKSDIEALLSRTWLGDGQRLQLSAYRQAVKESTLSYIGIEDEDYSFGRVMRSGLSGEWRKGFAKHWSASYVLKGERLTGGKWVENNERYYQEAGVGYNLRPPGLDYAVLSLNYSHDHFEKNLGQFSGGYFSPQKYIRVGPAFDFMTREKAPYIIKGRLAFGHTHKKEDDWPEIPSTIAYRNKAYYSPGDTDKGSARDYELGATWLLTPSLQVGGWASYRKSPEYLDSAVMLFFNVLFEPRHSVLSRDLPNQNGARLF